MHTTEIVVSESRDYGSWHFEAQYDGTWVCHHNGDFSGEVWIQPPGIPLSHDVEPIKIPFAVMKELVGKYLRDRQISKLEQQSGSTFVDGIDEKERQS